MYNSAHYYRCMSNSVCHESALISSNAYKYRQSFSSKMIEMSVIRFWYAYIIDYLPTFCLYFRFIMHYSTRHYVCVPHSVSPDSVLLSSNVYKYSSYFLLKDDRNVGNTILIRIHNWLSPYFSVFISALKCMIPHATIFVCLIVYVLTQCCLIQTYTNTVHIFSSKMIEMSVMRFWYAYMIDYQPTFMSLFPL